MKVTLKVIQGGSEPTPVPAVPLRRWIQVSAAVILIAMAMLVATVMLTSILQKALVLP